MKYKRFSPNRTGFIGIILGSMIVIGTLLPWVADILYDSIEYTGWDLFGGAVHSGSEAMIIIVPIIGTILAELAYLDLIRKSTNATRILSIALCIATIILVVITTTDALSHLDPIYFKVMVGPYLITMTAVILAAINLLEINGTVFKMSKVKTTHSGLWGMLFGLIVIVGVFVRWTDILWYGEYLVVTGYDVFETGVVFSDYYFLVPFVLMFGGAIMLLTFLEFTKTSNNTTNFLNIVFAAMAATFTIIIVLNMYGNTQEVGVPGIGAFAVVAAATMTAFRNIGEIVKDQRIKRRL